MAGGSGVGVARERTLAPNRQTTFGEQVFEMNRDLDTKSIGGRSRESQPMEGLTEMSNKNPNISIHDNKREYLKEKKRKDLETLENDLKKEKERLARLED